MSNENLKKIIKNLNLLIDTYYKDLERNYDFENNILNTYELNKEYLTTFEGINTNLNNYNKYPPISNLIKKIKEIIDIIKNINTQLYNLKDIKKNEMKLLNNIISNTYNNINILKKNIVSLLNETAINSNRFIIECNKEPVTIIDTQTNFYWEIYFMKKILFNNINKFAKKQNMLLPDAVTWQTLTQYQNSWLANFLRNNNHDTYNTLFWLIDYNINTNIGRSNLFETGAFGPNTNGELCIALFTSINLKKA